MCVSDGLVNYYQRELRRMHKSGFWSAVSCQKIHFDSCDAEEIAFLSSRSHFSKVARPPSSKIEDRGLRLTLNLSAYGQLFFNITLQAEYNWRTEKEHRK